MTDTPHLFLDDPNVQQAIHEASRLATLRLAELLPLMAKNAAPEFETVLRQYLERLLTGRAQENLPRFVWGHDAFGDPFDLNQLPLPRAGTGYAVQQLGSDTLLDRQKKTFLPVRNPDLDALFERFDLAFEAAREWLSAQNVGIEDVPLAIVPAFHNAELQRHVLVHGVLPLTP